MVMHALKRPAKQSVRMISKSLVKFKNISGVKPLLISTSLVHAPFGKDLLSQPCSGMNNRKRAE
jgi:hypothetical protein